MRYDYSQDLANELLEKSDKENDLLSSLLQRVLNAHKHYAGQTALGYWGRVQNIELDRVLDEIEKTLKTHRPSRVAGRKRQNERTNPFKY